MLRATYGCALISVLATALPLTAANWPGWRGDGNGVSAEKNLPVYWSADQGIAWKTPLPGEGNSSPVIWGDKVFLTASLEAGKKRLVLGLDAKDGKILWQRELPAARTPETYAKNGYASPTPVTDGQRVYAFFDSPGAVALDLAGNVLWTRDLGPFKNSYNLAVSPVLCDGSVIFCCDQDEKSFITALDPATGAERWRTPRQNQRQYATPLVITVGGKHQLVVNGMPVIAYDPKNGKELWRCGGMMQMPTPSAVFANDQVYVTSGRNGPSMVIDPRGTGDVTESKGRMLATTGGPYVPSPLACPELLLPGDDGVLRMLHDSGMLFCELRIPGHYTASPVAGDGMVYWPSEKGDVAVVRLDHSAKAPAPSMRLLTVNHLGARCLASPAIAEGRLFIRTDKELFCLSGVAKPVETATAPAPAAADFATLAKRFKDHPAAEEGADIAIRLDVVETFGRTKEAQAVPLLLDAAHKDPHWDVSEAATKALAEIGEPAVPAMLTLVAGGDWRPYLKIIPAQALGALQRTDAVPALLKIAGHNDPLVRTTALQALTQIAAAKPDQAPQALPALITGIDDRDSAVRVAALEGVTLLAQYTGDRTAAVQARVLVALTSRNPRVARAALTAADYVKIPKERLMRDVLLYGEQRPEPVVRDLAAGPVKLKFQDGELRYLRIGDKEIVRRIYFAVRDEHWDTVMPEFSKLDVEKTEGGFRIKLAAECRNDVAAFSWTGEIVGTPDGKITFAVEGGPDRDFTSPRCGLNVLFGAESLAGQEYGLTNELGDTAHSTFPVLVANTLLAQRFASLAYTCNGMDVSVGLAAGTTFGMEDQRNFCDSSYKAFSGIALPYPSLKKGLRGKQLLTLAVKNAPAAFEKPPLPVTAKLPRLVAVTKEPVARFVELNQKPEAQSGAATVGFAFNPTAHMPDDDTLFENCSAVVDQVATFRALALKAKFRIGPIDFNSPYPRPGPDPRNRGMFAAAWTVRMVKYLAFAGVDEAAIAADPAFGGRVLGKLVTFAGDEMTGLPTPYGLPGSAVEEFSVLAYGKPVIWLANLTSQPVDYTVDRNKFGKARKVSLERLLAPNGAAAATWHAEPAIALSDVVRVQLPAFGVCLIHAK